MPAVPEIEQQARSNKNFKAQYVNKNRSIKKHQIYPINFEIAPSISSQTRSINSITTNSPYSRAKIRRLVALANPSNFLNETILL